MKRFLIFITSLVIMTCGCSRTAAANTYSYSELIELIAEQETYMEAAHQMAESARALGYSEDHVVIQLAIEEWNCANNALEELYNNYMVIWQEKEEEHPIATYIWIYFKEKGYSDEVCAGILGNIMAEAGGNTLDINPYSTNGNHYGICQWNGAYSEVWGASLEEQCDYLYETIENEFNIFGYAYDDNFNYDDFLALDDERDVALAFCKVYERCNSRNYKVRKKNASIAYEYFVD